MLVHARSKIFVIDAANRCSKTIAIRIIIKSCIKSKLQKLFTQIYNFVQQKRCWACSSGTTSLTLMENDEGNLEAIESDY